MSGLLDLDPMSDLQPIRARIRQALQAAPNQTPAMVTEAILPRLTDAEVYEALKAALPYLVRDEIRKVRHDALGVLSEPRAEAQDRAAGWRMDPEHESAPDRAESARRARDTAQQRRENGRRGHDAAQQQRDRQQALLDTPMNVNGRWTTLGECTADDLRAVAHGQRERAAENDRRAGWFEQLAENLEQQGVATVADYQGEIRAVA